MKKETDCPTCEHINLCKYKDEAMKMQYKADPFTLHCEYYEPKEKTDSAVEFVPVPEPVRDWWEKWRFVLLIGYAVVIPVLILLESLGVLPC